MHASAISRVDANGGSSSVTVDRNGEGLRLCMVTLVCHVDPGRRMPVVRARVIGQAPA